MSKRRLVIGDMFFVLKAPTRAAFKSNEEAISFNFAYRLPGNRSIQIKGIYMDRFVGVTFRLPGPLFMIHRCAFDDEELFDPITL